MKVQSNRLIRPGPAGGEGAWLDRFAVASLSIGVRSSLACTLHRGCPECKHWLLVRAAEDSFLGQGRVRTVLRSLVDMVMRLSAQPSLQRPGLWLWRVRPSSPLTLQLLLGQRTSLFPSSSHKGPGLTSFIQRSSSVSKTKTQAKLSHPVLLRAGFASRSQNLRAPPSLG